MTREIIAIRPEPGLAETIAAGRGMGLPMHGLALSHALPCEWSAPDPAQYDALLVGSANAFRHGGDQLGALQHLPVLAVGEKTAQAAREAGFTVSHLGEGGLQGLLDELRLDDLGANAPKRFLRLSGKDHVTLDPPAGVSVDKIVVYKMEPIALSPQQADQLQSPAIVLLYSASSAKHFTQQCEALGVDKSQITLAALGPRIADAAGEGWAAVHAADKPRDAQLLALAQSLWQM